MSIRPGSKVVWGRSILVVSGRALRLVTGPTSTMRLLLTRTAQPSRTWPSESKIRAGVSRKEVEEGGCEGREAGSPASARADMKQRRSATRRGGIMNLPNRDWQRGGMQDLCDKGNRQELLRMPRSRRRPMDEPTLLISRTGNA